MSEKSEKKESRTDWNRIESMRDGDIDTSDSPELDASFFEEAVVWPASQEPLP